MTASSESRELAGRERLCLALDCSDLAAGRQLAGRLRPYFATVKVGLELFAAAGPEAVTTLVGDGFAVFVDLKLHDIPTTVGRAARVLGRLGAAMVTLHAAGGRAMLEAGVEGLSAGAAEAGLARPMALGVTVLTSEPAAPDLVATRVGVASVAGCGGVVCAASDLELVRAVAPALFTVVPGVRKAGSPVHDQARTATPAEALAAGASLLVVGRAVAAAEDPELAAAAVLAEIEQRVVPKSPIG